MFPTWRVSGTRAASSSRPGHRWLITWLRAAAQLCTKTHQQPADDEHMTSGLVLMLILVFFWNCHKVLNYKYQQPENKII